MDKSGGRMKVFCEKCQQTVGQVADEKIPLNKSVSTKCPKCGSKITLSRTEETPLPPPPTELQMETAENGDKEGPPQSEMEERQEERAAAPTSSSRAETPPTPQTEQRELEPSTPPAEYNTAYNFSIGEVIKEAWQKTSGAKGPLWGAMIIYVLASMIVGAIITFLGGFLGGGEGSPIGFALQITVSIALYPLLVGIIMIGVRRAADLPISATTVFNYFTYMVPIIISSILITICTFIGFMLLVIPGIYLSLAYILTLPLIADRELGAWQAMELSRKAITRRWFKIFGLYIAMAVIMLISSIPFGIGLIWTMPMAIVMGGILYRTIYGVEEQ